MATIVQPYNPWRERLAVTVLGDVLGDALGDMWKQHKQNEQNKKANAFREQLLQDIQSSSGAQAPVSLTQQNLPEGYNNNGWDSSFHESFTPLTAFDIGTSGIGATKKLPTAEEVQRLGTNLASTKRFAMLNPETIQGFISQITKQNEEQRLKDLQNEAISHFMNAGNWDDRMNVLTSGMINGGVPADTLNNFVNYAKWRQQPFSFGSIKAGDRIYPTVNNPNTGEISIQNAFPIGVSPDALLNAQARQYQADINAASRANSPLKWQGSVYEAQVNRLYKTNEGIDANIADLRNQLEGTTDKNALEIINKKIEALETRKQQNIDEARAIMRGFAGGEKIPQQAQANQPQTSGTRGDYGFSGKTSNGGEYSDLINKYSEKHNIDPDLIAAMMTQESGFKKNAVSDKGAQGLMQIMPRTAKELGINDPFDPEQNIEGGIRYFAKQLEAFGGDIELALRAYNAGPDATRRGRYPEETKLYVRNILAIYRKLKTQRKSQPTQAQTQNSSTAQQNTTATPNVAPALGDGDKQNAQASTQQNAPSAFPPDAYLVNSNGIDFLTQEQFLQMARESGLSEDDLFRELGDKGYATPDEMNRRLRSFTPLSPEQRQKPLFVTTLGDWLFK